MSAEQLTRQSRTTPPNLSVTATGYVADGPPEERGRRIRLTAQRLRITRNAVLGRLTRRPPVVELPDHQIDDIDVVALRPQADTLRMLWR